MITLVEALGYRCLRYISQPLDPFHVLVGPNASGKTTFLDVIAFLGRLVSDGPDAAIEERTQNFYDLVWRGEVAHFQMAIEAQIPQELRKRPVDEDLDTVRYEVAVKLDPVSQERGLLAERVFFKKKLLLPLDQRSQFQQATQIPSTILEENLENINRYILVKAQGGDLFAPEVTPGSLLPTFKLGPRRSALANLPADESSYPISFWLKELLISGVQQIILNSVLISKASPPGLGRGFRSDGSNLPWVVADLRHRSPERFQQWIAHLQTAFPDLEDIETIERPEDRHRYLVLRYSGGLKVPSWMASDGTLRMLALTLPAYLEDFKGIYLIEEPENGIHPRAIETMTQSMSSVYNAQVLMATHSPIILSTVEAEQILCFSKNAEGATEIVRGSEHPALRDWKHETGPGGCRRDRARVGKLGLERLSPCRDGPRLGRPVSFLAGVADLERLPGARAMEAGSAQGGSRKGLAARLSSQIFGSLPPTRPDGRLRALHGRRFLEAEDDLAAVVPPEQGMTTPPEKLRRRLPGCGEQRDVAADSLTLRQGLLRCGELFGVAVEILGLR
ncbi:MAG TPA: ATP-binding protein [Thermoanaerobaculia bacterium]|nr:ATP-binding protein [Thermoanaerobaculia bacterium]